MGCKLFESLGARYLWANLIKTNYVSRTPISDHDFLLFGIMLKSELDVTKKTLRTYIMDAQKATHLAGLAPSHPKENATLTLLNYMESNAKTGP